MWLISDALSSYQSLDLAPLLMLQLNSSLLCNMLFIRMTPLWGLDAHAGNGDAVFYWIGVASCRLDCIVWFGLYKVWGSFSSHWIFHLFILFFFFLLQYKFKFNTIVFWNINEAIKNLSNRSKLEKKAKWKIWKLNKIK